MIRSTCVTKASLTLCALFISALAVIPQARSYEASVYSGIHPITIALFLVLVGCGVSLIVVTAGTDADYSMAGLLALTVASFGIFAPPLVRGYPMYASFAADQLSHLGTVSDVLATGTLFNDRYPGSHILYAVSSVTTGTSPEAFIEVIPFLFFVGLVAFSALVVWGMTGDKTVTLCAILAGAPIAFGIYRLSMMPWLFALTFLPLIVFCVHRHVHGRGGAYWGVVGIALLAGTTIYHPISTIFTLIAIGGYVAALYVARHPVATPMIHERMFPLVTAAGIFLTAWYILSDRLVLHLQSLFLRLISGEAGSVTRATEASAADPTLGQIIWYFFFPEAGVLTVRFAIGGIVFLTLAWRVLRHQADLFESFVTVQYTIGAILSIGFLAIQIYGTNFARVGQYLVVVSVFAVAIGIAYVTRRITMQPRGVFVAVALTGLLSGQIIFGGAMAYERGDHITDTTLTGHGWLLDYHAPGEQLVADTGRDRVAFYHYGYERAIERRSQGKTIASHVDPPDRLGYHTNATVAASVGNGYLVTRRDDLRAYAAEPEWRLASAPHYEATDVERLGADPTANKIYSNKAYTSWRIKAEFK